MVKLGPGNDEAAQESVRTWPNGLQVAGSITDKNAQYWIDQGAEKVSPPALELYSSLYRLELPVAVFCHFTCSNV